MTNATSEKERFYVRVSNAITGSVLECRGFFDSDNEAREARERAWQEHQFYSKREYLTMTIEKE